MTNPKNPENWTLPGTAKDKQSITRDWQAFDQTLIDGVTVTEIKNVVTSRGYLTEIYQIPG